MSKNHTAKEKDQRLGRLIRRWNGVSLRILDKPRGKVDIHLTQTAEGGCHLVTARMGPQGETESLTYVTLTSKQLLKLQEAVGIVVGVAPVR